MTKLATSTFAIGAGLNLFAGAGAKSAPAAGYSLASGLTGALKAGLPLKQGSTATTLTPITAAADQVVAILAEDVADASTDTGISVYEEGEFNKYTVTSAIIARGVESVTSADLAVKARMKGIYFKDVVKA